MKRFLILFVCLFSSLAVVAQITFLETLGSYYNNDGNYVAQTSDGGYIISGDKADYYHERDVYLIKTKANGDTLWTKTYGEVGYDYGNSIQQTIDGGYIITGSTYSLAAGGEGVYLIKITPTLNR